MTTKRTAPKLSSYDPKYANAKVSAGAMANHLINLRAIAEDPAKVKAWAERVCRELGKCELAF